MNKAKIRQAVHTLSSPLLNLATPLLSPMRPGNAVMFHVGRCGSTVVGKMLNQHPKIHWASELYPRVFDEWRRSNAGVETVGQMPQDAIAYLKNDMRFALHRFYGFEMKPFHFHLVGYSEEAFLDHLKTLGFSHYIHLDRKNRLRKIISSVVAHQTRYHLKHGAKPQLTKVHLDIHDLKIDFDRKPLIEYLSDYDRDMHKLETLLKDRNTLHLTYEDDIQEDPQKAYAKICGFFGIPTARASAKLARTNPFPLKDMVENYKEVEQALTRTPYEWMLEE